MAALAALSLASCQQFSEGSFFKSKDSFTLRVVCAEDDTRTDISDNKTVWKANDQIWLSDGKNSVTVAVPAEYAGTTGAEIVVTGLSKDSTIYATYPANSANTVSNGGIVVTVPTVQDGSFASAHIAVGKVLPGQTELAFKNATSILKFSHDNEDYCDLQIRDLDLAFSGSYVINPVTGAKMKAVADHRTVHVTMDGTEDKYIGVLPGKLTRNSKLTFVTKDGKLGSFAVTTLNTFERNVIYEMGNIDSKVTYYGVAQELDAAETANSYIVPGPGVYKFKAVKGNTIQALPGAAFAEILWETDNTATARGMMTLVSEIALSNGCVYFRVPEDAPDGNAMVAVYNKSGEILWSWHLWVLKDGVTDVTFAAGTGAVIMDRNLGAMTSTKGLASSLGLLYQWGRKDPFTGSSSITTNQLAVASGICTPGAVARTDNNGTVAYALAHPYQFIYKSQGNWLVSDNLALWSADSKTVYDPCPAGYHVPYSDIITDVQAKWDSGNKGYSIPAKDGREIWFPIAGSRLSGSGSLGNVGTLGVYWFDKNSRTKDKRNAWKVTSSYFEVDTTTNHPYCGGFAMRCQKNVPAGDKQNLTVKFTTIEENECVYSPSVAASGRSEAQIIWSPDFSEHYEVEKWMEHLYGAPADYSLTITGYTMNSVKFKSLGGITSIDFSSF